MKNLLIVFIFNFTFSASFSQNNIYTLLGHNGNVNTVAFTKDSKYLLSGSLDSTIKIWNIENNFAIEKTIPFSKASITNISFSPSGNEFTICTYKTFFTYRYPEFKLVKKKNYHANLK